MAMDWMSLKRKRYDANGNEIDENGNIVNPAFANPAPAQNNVRGNAASSFIAKAPEATGGGGSGIGSTLDTVGSGVSALGPYGAIAGTALKVVGGLMNSNEKEQAAAAAERQKRNDMNAEQQRLDMAGNENRYRDNQRQGMLGMNWLSQQADTAHGRRNEYRGIFARAMGY
jgi:hypothetical protein